MKERLQKLMARADLGSRRHCETLIEQGRVTVNGKTATLGDKADPEVDDIRVDGARLKLAGFRKRYIVFYKPRDVLTTNKAPDGDDRATVRDLIPVEGHLFTIGRLDADSEGLLVLTNDGEMANRLAHPRYEHTKTYKVTLYGQLSDENIATWEQGIWLEEGKTAPCAIQVVERSSQTTIIRITMIEGRKRQIRRIAGHFGHSVKHLLRTHIGQLGLGTLRRGEWYELDDEEVAAMLLPAESLKRIRRLRSENRRRRTRSEN